MDSQKIILVLSSDDVQQRQHELALLSKEQKTDFCNEMARGLIDTKIQAGIKIHQNVLNDFAVLPKQRLNAFNEAESIKRVNKMLIDKLITVPQVLYSLELKNAFNTIKDLNSNFGHCKTSIDLILTTIQQIDIKSMEFEMFAIELMSLEPLIAMMMREGLIEKIKLLVGLFSTFGKKLVLQNNPYQQVLQRIINIMLTLSEFHNLAPKTYNFWTTFLKTMSQRSDKLEFEPLLEELLLKFARNLKWMKETKMEAKNSANDDLLNYEKDLALIIRSMASVLNVGRIIQFSTISLSQLGISSIDAEIHLFILENVVEFVKVNEKEVVEDLLKILLECPPSSLFYKQSILIIGYLNKWLAKNNENVPRILHFLSEALCKAQQIADAAAEVLKEICKQCQNVMTPYLFHLFTILENVNSFDLSDDGQADIIKGIAAVIESLPGHQMEQALRKLLEIVVSKIQQFRHLEPLKFVEQLAEIFERIYPETREGQNVAAKVFIDFWPVLQQMFEFFEDNEKIVEKLLEIVESVIQNYKDSLLPIIDDILMLMMNLNFKTQGKSIFDLCRKILNTFGSKFPEQVLVMFEAIFLRFLSFLNCDGEIDLNFIDSFYKLATEFVMKTPIEFMQIPSILKIIELAVQALNVDLKENHAIKFLHALLMIEGNDNLKICQRQIMSIYGDVIIQTILQSSIYVLDTCRMASVIDLLFVFKQTSNEGFKDSFKKACQKFPLLTPFGAQDAYEKLNMLHETITSNSAKANCVTLLKNLKKYFNI